MSFRSVAGVFLLAILCSTVFAASNQTLSFKQRLFYQERVERVYYDHRTGVKLPFNETVPHSELAAKVKGYLAQSEIVMRANPNAITDATLQRELERICRFTKAPDTLRAIFAALNNTPFLIKEILVRPILAEKFSRELYQQDDSFHDATLGKATAIKTQLNGLNWQAVAKLNQVSYQKTTLELKGADAKPSLNGASTSFEVDEALLQNRYAALKDLDSSGTLQRTETSYVIQRLRNARFERNALKSIEVESILVPWRSFEEWMELKKKTITASNSISQIKPDPSMFASLPVINSSVTNCTPDSWTMTSTPYRAPNTRFGHSAVWTGSEMIIWGGNDGLSYLNDGSRYTPATDSWVTTSTAFPPSVRASASAVWTGSEMIVWGGSNGSVYLDTGGRYNPSTDSWIDTTTEFAPSPRGRHTAVWTGTRMIIWGGEDASAYLDSGSSYNPSTDSWTNVTGAGAPSARSSHSAVWTGSRMIIWGGQFLTLYLNSGGSYDPGTNSWTTPSTTNAPVGRKDHTAVWTGTSMIIWGGSNGSDLNSGGRYSPSTDTWTSTTTTAAPSARSVHTAVWTGTEMIVWGGLGGGAQNTGARYNPSSDSWTSTSLTNAPSIRYMHTAVWTGTEMIVWGGYNGSFAQFTGGRYSPTQDSWTSTSTSFVPVPVFGHTAVWTGAEMIVWGGNDGTFYFQYGGRYNPAVDTWTAMNIGVAPQGRSFHTAVWTGTRMVVWGGTDGVNYLDTGGRYNPALDAWAPTTTTSAPTPRSLHTAVWTGNRMIVWGGRDSSVYYQSGAFYNPATDSWAPTSTVGPVPTPRAVHTAVWTGSRMIVWGGYDGTFLNTGSIFNPGTNNWTNFTNLTNAPTGRQLHSAVWTGTEMIVWGGHNGAPLGTGARYNPSTDSWTATDNSTSPSARLLHTAVWTGSEMIVWGGLGSGGGSGTVNTGARYDPVSDSWTDLPSTGAPSARDYHRVVWTGTQMIVWGGYDGSALGTGGVYSPDCPCTDPYESNDSFSEATPITAAIVYDAKICTADDYDYFKITIASGGTFDITMEPPTGVNYDLFLYDSTFTLIAASTLGVNQTEAIQRTVPAAGTYYALVRSSGANESSDNNYTLYYFFTPCALPTARIYIYGAHLDVKTNVELDFMDPNQPSVVTGYNVYRAPSSSGPWTLIASNVVNMDNSLPNLHYVDSSGTNCGGTCYFQIAAYNGSCGAEGPWP